MHAAHPHPNNVKSFVLNCETFGPVGKPVLLDPGHAGTQQRDLRHVEEPVVLDPSHAGTQQLNLRHGEEPIVVDPVHPGTQQLNLRHGESQLFWTRVMQGLHS